MQQPVSNASPMIATDHFSAKTSLTSPPDAVYNPPKSYDNV
jgi:hypothetical protein